MPQMGGILIINRKNNYLNKGEYTQNEGDDGSNLKYV